MVFVNMTMTGMKELTSYLDGVRKRVIVETEVLPRTLAFETRRQIKAAIRGGRTYIGRYHKRTGIGLAEFITASQTR